jgi:hypothetical protein
MTVLLLVHASALSEGAKILELISEANEEDYLTTANLP